MVRRSAKYDRVFAAVKSVVDANDPIGLLDGGAPSDEYGAEVADLTVMVLRSDPIAEDAIDKVWMRRFGLEFGSVRSQPLARMTAELRAIQEQIAEE